MNEFITLVAVLSTVFGAILSTVKGYYSEIDKGTNYKVSRLISSLIIAIMASLTVINFGVISETISNIGVVGLIVFQLGIGFGVDQGLSKLDK